MKKFKGLFKFNKKKIFLLNNDSIVKIFKKNFNRYRICLHKSEKSNFQESIIFTKGYNYFRTHIHPKKVSETYIVIKGELCICLLNKNGKIIKKILLKEKTNNSKLPFIYNLTRSEYHLVIPLMDQVIFYEITSGRFSDKNFIKYHKSAPNEKSLLSQKIDYSSKLSGINIYKKFKIEK